jgi:cation diffusion facilitator CzcD-associated flavoprotein CzcO
MRIVHSSDTANFKSDVENKNILIIGGGLSAEDLALMAIKEG